MENSNILMSPQTIQKKVIRKARPQGVIPPRHSMNVQAPAILEQNAGKQVDSSVSCQNCTQHYFCLPHGLAAGEIEHLEALVSQRRILKRGEYLFHEGDKGKYLFAVRSGAFKTLRSTHDGNEQVLGFSMGGELIGLEALGQDSYTSSAVAIEPASVCQFSVKSLEHLARGLPALQHQMYLLFSQQLVNSYASLALLGKGRAEAGLAALLLTMAARFKVRGYSGNDFNLSMSRGDIGNYLGISTETVSRTFTSFHKQGLISVDKRRIVICQHDRLLDMARDLMLDKFATSEYRVM